MSAKLHPIVALWRTIGKEMSASEFRNWYHDQQANERLELARIAAEELGCELEEAGDKPNADDANSKKLKALGFSKRFCKNEILWRRKTMRTSKPNRRRQQDERGRKKRPMRMSGAPLRRIPGIQRKRADRIKKKSS